ncbi:MAG: DUF1515 domain-containing protein [Endomicrobium sp.]|jgi:uncharacterized membrane protein YqgA involved in biofilm formation|nr:DUF1515 domain-containing protein [Endomicrobium sp.]
MIISPEIAVNVVVLCVGIGVFVGEIKSLKKDIKRLEEKQDKHNRLIERMVVVEQSIKAAHHRIDDMQQK